jgi:hypothetical protein
MNTRLIFAAVVVIGMSGCASQGGGKLDHNEAMAAQQLNNDTIQVCNQTGAVMTCHTEDREQVRDELEYRLQSLNYQR